VLAQPHCLRSRQACAHTSNPPMVAAVLCWRGGLLLPRSSPTGLWARCLPALSLGARAFLMPPSCRACRVLSCSTGVSGGKASEETCKTNSRWRQWPQWPQIHPAYTLPPAWRSKALGTQPRQQTLGAGLPTPRPHLSGSAAGMRE